MVGGLGVSDLSAALAAEVRLRVAAGDFSAQGLGRLVGVSQPHMSNWLGGRRRLGPRHCDAVMGELGVDLLGLLAARRVVGPAPPARGVLVEMPRRGKGRRSPWRRRVDPAAVAAELRGDPA